MQTLVSMGVDLIFLDCVDPTAAVASIQLTTDADIGVINLDSGVDDGTAQITTVYSDNEQNGLKVGQEFVKTFNEKTEPIRRSKESCFRETREASQRRAAQAGSDGRHYHGADRLHGRRGMDGGQGAGSAGHQRRKGENADANFTIVGQGWGNWTENGGLEAAEDILTANPDTNLIMGENDSMVLGAMSAIDNAGKKAGEDIIDCGSRRFVQRI